MKMMKIILIIIFALPISVSAQTQNTKVIEGSVSYISSQNIYVKFNSTDGIETGDTLFIKDKSNFIPAVKIDHKSSTSCAGTSITNKKLEVSNLLYAFLFTDDGEIDSDTIQSTTIAPVVISTVTADEIVTKTSLQPVPTLSGRFSVQSFSNFTNNQSSYDYQRWRYTFQLNAGRIANSGFSYSQYISFAYRADDWSTISSDLFKALRVYDLAVKYDFNERTLLWLGRHLNSKISNISSIDGLQFESGVDNWSFGAAVG